MDSQIAHMDVEARRAGTAKEVTDDGTTRGKVRQVQVSLAEFREIALNQLKKAVEQKEKGSKAYGAGQIEQAETCYVEALTLVDAAKQVDAVRRKDFSDVLNRLETTELMCHLNLAACSLNQKRYEEALEECRLVLRIDEKNVKAMYRAGKALFLMSNFDEAVDVLKEASKLSPTDKHIAALYSKAKKSLSDISKSQRSTFGGMFGKTSYIMNTSREAKRDNSLKVAERKDVEPKLRECIQSSSEVSLLDRWVSEGIVSFDEEEAHTLLKLAQRAAAAGKLDQAKERDLLSKHGLHIHTAEDQQNKLTPEERDAAEDQRELITVQALTKKLQEGHSLSEEEAQFLQSFRRKEIQRLERQLQTTGLGERDRMLLEGLRGQAQKYQACQREYEDKSSEVEDLLKQIESGRRIPVRQRLRMDELLREERIRLEEKDDDQGLTSTEWKLLRQIQKNQEKKKQEENARREKVEQRKQILQEMAR